MTNALEPDDVLRRTVDHVRGLLAGDSAGHDWWHIHRVWQMARRIAEAEGADRYVVQLAALLHDVADWKFHGGDETAGPRAAGAWLADLQVDAATIGHVQQIIR